jgi:hypothetical protein
MKLGKIVSCCVVLIIGGGVFCVWSAQAQTASPHPSVTPSPTPDNSEKGMSRADKLERRLKALEKKVNASLEPEENTRTVKSFLNTNVTIGGFFETALTSISESGRSTQVAASENTLGINVSAEFSDNLRFVSQFLTYVDLPTDNANGDPRGASVGLPSQAGFQTYTFGTILTQGYLEWSNSEAFNIQAGMGYVPYGITFQQLELVLFVRRGGPQLLRATDLVFPLWQGLHVHGSFALNPSRWGYDVYTFSGENNPQSPGGGGRLWWKSAEDAVNLGVSTQVAKRDFENDETYDTLGTDARLRFDRVTITTEASKSFSDGPQPWSFYIEPDVDVHNQSVLLYAFLDYLDNPNNRTGAGLASLADPYKKWEYGGGVNWLPTSYTRLRFGLTMNDFVGNTASNFGQNRNYWNLDASAGVAF